MIAVIADDFTGAAELAGIGLRYGLTVELVTKLGKKPDADIIVVCTDSRSMNKREAVEVTGRVVKDLLLLQPSFIYKKIDSVFRGHVLDELGIQMQQIGLQKAIVLAANPSLGRTIKDGIYYVNGEPVSETGFATDPEFAITDPSVWQMLRADDNAIQVLQHTDELAAEGIIIAGAETTDDVAAWADKVDNGSVVAGAGDFFTAILDKKHLVQPQEQPVLQSPLLYVCGTAFGKSNDFVRYVKEKRDCVIYLSPSIMQTGVVDSSWIGKADKILQEQGRAIIAIDPEERQLPDVSALSLRTAMAKAVKEIAGVTGIRELFIEGGSTASAVLAELGICTLLPVNELERGVVRMKAKEKDTCITVKPGSYLLSQQISALYS